jgi:hypothetical protein
MVRENPKPGVSPWPALRSSATAWRAICKASSNFPSSARVEAKVLRVTVTGSREDLLERRSMRPRRACSRPYKVRAVAGRRERISSCVRRGAFSRRHSRIEARVQLPRSVSGQAGTRRARPKRSRVKQRNAEAYTYSHAQRYASGAAKTAPESTSSSDAAVGKRNGVAMKFRKKALSKPVHGFGSHTRCQWQTRRPETQPQLQPAAKIFMISRYVTGPRLSWPPGTK